VIPATATTVGAVEATTASTRAGPARSSAALSWSALAGAGEQVGHNGARVRGEIADRPRHTAILSAIPAAILSAIPAAMAELVGAGARATMPAGTPTLRGRGRAGAPG